VLKDNRFRNALAHRDFRVLWLGSVVSSTGDGMTFVALAWLVLSRPGGTGRLGLLGMRERVEIVGGTVMIESSPGDGAAIYVRIPYRGR